MGPMIRLRPGDVLRLRLQNRRYCAIHTPFEPSGAVGNGRALAPRRMLAIVRAEGTGGSADPESALRTSLIRAAERALAGPDHAATRLRVIADLRRGLRLNAFVPLARSRSPSSPASRSRCSTISRPRVWTPRSRLTGDCTITNGLIAY